MVCARLSFKTGFEIRIERPTASLFRGPSDLSASMIGALQMRLTRSNFFVPLMTLVISCIAANVQAQPAANLGSYIFALSWSPGFCDMECDRERRPECRRGANLGFVIHGLWANDNNGQEIICDGGDDLSDRGKSRASAVFSDTGRANHEWKAHWSCLGVSEDDFVDAVTKARALISIPESLAAPSAPQSLDPEDIRGSFASTNSTALQRQQVTVTCVNRELMQVKFCVRADLSGFRNCEGKDRRSCPAAQVDQEPPR
jgi:ribonuclease T2